MSCTYVRLVLAYCVAAVHVHYLVFVCYFFFLLFSIFYLNICVVCSYHHTVSATLLYGLREALALVCKEGLENVIARHQKAAAALQLEVLRLGLQLHVRKAANRLPTITAVNLPRHQWKQIVDLAAKEYVRFSHL